MAAYEDGRRGELQAKASVLSRFDLRWLGVGPEEVDDDPEVLDFLLVDSIRVPNDGGDEGSWVLRDEVRRSVGTRLRFDGLHDAWTEIEGRDRSPLQRVLDQVVGRAETLTLRELDPAERQAAAQVGRWFGHLGPPFPDLEEVEDATQFEALLEPLRQVTGRFFRDRVDELARLRNAGEGTTTHIVGMGGIGKSALVGRCVLDAVERGVLICYLNFDHNALHPSQPATLVRAIARQLSWQISDTEVADAVEFEGEQIARKGDSVSKVAGRSLSISGARWRRLVRDLGVEFGTRPVLMVFDTMEQAQRREVDLHQFRQLIDELHEEFNVQVITTGRAPIPELDPDPIVLAGLPTDDGVALLGDLAGAEGGTGEPRSLDEDECRRIGELIGTSPLCIRLAAGILRTTPAEESPFADLDLTQGVIEGELYRRLLSHIPDESVRTLAYPGLVLRIVTPTLVQEVLAEACGLTVPTAAAALDLFNGLAREGMLIEHIGVDKIAHRSDLRPMMISRLTHDHRDAVTEIHRGAVAYYDGPGADEPEARLERLYHLLMLAEDPDIAERLDALDPHYDELAELALSIDELPAPGKVWLVDRNAELDVGFTDADLAEMNVARRRQAIERRVERMLLSDETAQAAQLLADNRLDDGRSVLPLIELQTLELLGRVGEAAEIAAQEQERLIGLGDLVGTVELALHRARLWELQNQVQDGADHLSEVRRRVLTRSSPALDALLRLRVVTSLLRLRRLGADVPVDPGAVATTDDAGVGSVADPLEAEAAHWFDRVPRVELMQQQELLRDLVGELGGDAPISVLVAALEAGVLSDEDGDLGRRLQQFDAEVSQARGREAGVLAEVADIEVDDDGGADWESWIGTQPSSKAATDVGQLIRQFDEEVPVDVKRSIARQYREASDAAYHYRS